MSALKPTDTLLTGRWQLEDGAIVADPVAEKIEFLKTHVLKPIKASSDGWSVLYQDPNDQRYWELTYPESELHGGGPPQLAQISESEAIWRYKLGAN
jgi:hypothetical protein